MECRLSPLMWAYLRIFPRMDPKRISPFRNYIPINTYPPPPHFRGPKVFGKLVSRMLLIRRVYSTPSLMQVEQSFQCLYSCLFLAFVNMRTRVMPMTFKEAIMSLSHRPNNRLTKTNSLEHCHCPTVQILTDCTVWNLDLVFHTLTADFQISFIYQSVPSSSEL